MLVLGSIGFTAPWLLLGLLGLPILWILLRVVPPVPIRRRFPGVALLLGLTDDESETDKTPWWLLLLRMLAVAAAIVAFAGPVLNPETEVEGSGPLLIIADGTWADARDWERRQGRIAEAVDEAARAGRPVALATLTDLPVGGVLFQAAEQTQPALPSLQPQAWEADEAAVDAFIAALPEEGFDTLWLSDGLAREGRDRLTEALGGRGLLSVVETPREVLGLRPAVFDEGLVRVTALRSRTVGTAEIEVAAQGFDPGGIVR